MLRYLSINYAVLKVGERKLYEWWIVLFTAYGDSHLVEGVQVFNRLIVVAGS